MLPLRIIRAMAVIANATSAGFTEAATEASMKNGMDSKAQNVRAARCKTSGRMAVVVYVSPKNAIPAQIPRHLATRRREPCGSCQQAGLQNQHRLSELVAGKTIDGSKAKQRAP